MKHGFLVTSTIEPNPKSGFKNYPNRSGFDAQERLRQTIAGLLNLNVADPSARIFLVDSSPNRYSEIDSLPNVTYIQLRDLDPVACEIANSHTSKSHCESLLIKTFLDHFMPEIQSLDFVTKVSGRYLLDHSYTTAQYTAENLNKFFFKNSQAMTHPVEHLRPSFKAVLPDEIIINDEIRGFLTSIFGVGRDRLDFWHWLLCRVIADTNTRQSKFYYIDVEYIIYYYMQKLQALDSVIQTDWKIYGWGGQDGGYYCA